MTSGQLLLAPIWPHQGCPAFPSEATADASSPPWILPSLSWEKKLATPLPWPTSTPHLCLRTSRCLCLLFLPPWPALVAVLHLVLGWDTLHLPTLYLANPYHPSILSSGFASSRKSSLTTSPSSPMGSNASSEFPHPRECPHHGVVHGLLGNCSPHLTGPLRTQKSGPDSQ